MKKYISRLPRVEGHSLSRPAEMGKRFIQLRPPQFCTPGRIPRDDAVFRIGIPQLLAQVGDVHPQVVRIFLMLGAPDFTEKLAVGHHLALMEQQKAQNAVFLGGQMDFLLPLLHAPGAQVHNDGSQPEYGGLPVRPVAPQHHAQARQQFPAAERLGQVIVRPGVQGVHLLILPVPGRQDQNGNLRPFPELFEHFQSVDVRKAQVQNNGVRPFQSGLAQAELPVFTLADMVACAGQRQVQETAYLPFVINNQDICGKVAHNTGKEGLFFRNMIMLHQGKDKTETGSGGNGQPG